MDTNKEENLEELKTSSETNGEVNVSASDVNASNKETEAKIDDVMTSLNVADEKQAPVDNKINETIDADVNINDNPNLTEEDKKETMVDDKEKETGTSNISDNDAKDDIIMEDVSNEDTKQETSVEEETPKMSKGKKTALITILFILLILDIFALVVYIIGIDKVFSFIK